jgi:hypothetical protein
MENDFIFGICTVVFVVVFVIYMIFLGFHPELQDKNDKKQIKKVFDNFSKKWKPVEKIAVIEKLFAESIIHANSMDYTKNSVNVVVYGYEISLHIYSLWLANLTSKTEFQSESEKIMFRGKIKCCNFAVKNELNKLLNSLDRKQLSIEEVENIIQARVDQIYCDKDFEIRNFNFCNLCNYEISEINENINSSDNIFTSENISELPMSFGNPLSMMILPSAYKSGLVNKYLALLEKVF